LTGSSINWSGSMSRSNIDSFGPAALGVYTGCTTVAVPLFLVSIMGFGVSSAVGLSSANSNSSSSSYSTLGFTGWAAWMDCKIGCAGRWCSNSSMSMLMSSLMLTCFFCWIGAAGCNEIDPWRIGIRTGRVGKSITVDELLWFVLTCTTSPSSTLMSKIDSIGCNLSSRIWNGS